MFGNNPGLGGIDQPIRLYTQADYVLGRETVMVVLEANQADGVDPSLCSTKLLQAAVAVIILASGFPRYSAQAEWSAWQIIENGTWLRVAIVRSVRNLLIAVS
jgi:hypothetical protein